VEHATERALVLVQRDRAPDIPPEEPPAMSFVTVFTVSTMAFVLVVPALMILALATVSPLRRSVTKTVQDARGTLSDRDRQAGRPDPERTLYAAA
jgi:hypothetical protein